MRNLLQSTKPRQRDTWGIRGVLGVLSLKGGTQGFRVGK